ncbi:MAG: IS1634 family transposase [Pseudomonadota bacterium]
MKKGRPYYYIRESARVNGKTKITNQVYLGSPEKILQMATAVRDQDIITVQCQEFGALWLANLVEKDIGIADIVDAVVQKKAREKGPSVGEYFLYAVYNRMVDACSKRALPEWYHGTAMQAIRPVAINELGSERYWEKWDRVTERHLEHIAQAFFRKLNELEPTQEDCFLFDTTNYYTFMAGDTESDLAQRGKNKVGRHWLRQVGVALLVSRDHQIPLYYKEYEGNRHDSKVFARLLDDVMDAMERAGKKDSHLTIVVDKGMNSEDTMPVIDTRDNIHFITTYSLFFAKELANIALSRFEPVDTEKNRKLMEKGRHQDVLVALRTKGTYWGRERTVVVTYNPRTAAKQRYRFDEKLAQIQEALFEMRSKLRHRDRGWTRPGDVEKRYRKFCETIYMPSDLYDVDFEKDHLGWKMGFRKNHYRISKHIQKFGKNVIVTDHADWSTDDIVRASLDRYKVEMAFRQSKDPDLVALQPIRHWTDSKISCHVLTCVMALACVRIIEARLKKSGLHISCSTAMKAMQRLNSCLCVSKDRRKAHRVIEKPTALQANILRAFDHRVSSSGVLQQVSS